MITASNKSHIIIVVSMVDELEHKYEVEIKTTEKRQKIPDEVKAELKASG